MFNTVNVFQNFGIRKKYLKFWKHLEQELYNLLKVKILNLKKFLEKTGLKKGFVDKSHINSSASDIYLSKILESYPEINAEWLLTGKGEMLKPNVKEKQHNKSVANSVALSVANEMYKKSNTNEPEEYDVVALSNNRKTKDAIYSVQEVPLYNLEATAGLKELFSGGKSATAILDTIKIPHLPKCDGAISVTGDSMYPLLKSGDMVLYKEIPLDSIFYGEMYLLAYKIDEWEEYITVKYVQKSDLGDDHLKLVSQNPHHQPRDVKKAQITAIALIKASIRINTMM